MTFSLLKRATLIVIFVFACFDGPGVGAATAGMRADFAGRQWEGSLDEINDRARIFLLATRSSVVDANGADAAIVAEALKADSGKLRIHSYPYRVIARKLNEYIRKHRSMTAARSVAEADYVIYFSVLEYRRSLNGIYPFGELFVIFKPGAEDARPARIIWRTRKVMWAEDAVKTFVKELKRVRGER